VSVLRRIGRLLGMDAFILSIHLAVVAGALLPASTTVLPWVEWSARIAIGVLFFLYGVRIAPRDALDGLAHWRLHLTILTVTFGVFPLVGLALALLPSVALEPRLYAGVLFLCLVPSTVQASIAFTSLSGGNVPAAIASASASNLIGVFLTPALAAALMTSTGGTPVHGSAVLGLVLQLLLPFVLGQCVRPWVAGWVQRHARVTGSIGRESIVLVVYAAFSQGTHEGMWHRVSTIGLVQLVVLSIVLVFVMLSITGFASPRLGFDQTDTMAIQFCGTKKALVTGLPMAAVLFGNQRAGLLVLPLMIYHQVQLILCTWLARHYAGGAPVPTGWSDAPVARSWRRVRTRSRAVTGTDSRGGHRG